MMIANTLYGVVFLFMSHSLLFRQQLVILRASLRSLQHICRYTICGQAMRLVTKRSMLTCIKNISCSKLRSYAGGTPRHRSRWVYPSIELLEYHLDCRQPCASTAKGKRNTILFVPVGQMRMQRVCECTFRSGPSRLEQLVRCCD